jgi:hypothetical protein
MPQIQPNRGPQKIWRFFLLYRVVFSILIFVYYARHENWKTCGWNERSDLRRVIQGAELYPGNFTGKITEHE